MAKKNKAEGSGTIITNAKDRFITVMRTPLPPALEGKSQPLIYIGLLFLLVSLLQLIFRSMRLMSPFTAFIGVLMLIFAYLQRRSMVLTGYDEYLFRTLDYTYLLRFQKKPSGIVLLGESGPVQNEIYHVAIDNSNNVPPLNWRLRVYVPKDAIVSTYLDRKYFSKVFGYKVEEWED